VRYAEILSVAHLAVAPRGLAGGGAAMDLSVVDLPYTLLQLPVDAISATEIRQQNTTLTPATVQESVHPEVARYIAQHHLYSQSPT
jgi:nicotinic acid mononucleotide adenylyltransferase